MIFECNYRAFEASKGWQFVRSRIVKIKVTISMRC